MPPHFLSWETYIKDISHIFNALWENPEYFTNKDNGIYETPHNNKQGFTLAIEAH